MPSHLLGLITDTGHSRIEVDKVMAEVKKTRGPIHEYESTRYNLYMLICMHTQTYIVNIYA